MSRYSDKLGIFSWFGIELPLDERLRLIKEAGFGSTSIWLGDEEELVRDGKENLIPELVNKHRLFFENIHAPFENCNKIWSESNSIRSEIRDEYMSCIAFCSRYNVPVVVIHISKSDNPPELNKYGLDLIREIVKYAEDSNVVIAIENTRKYQYLDHIFPNIESPFLKFCYDSSHDFIWFSEPGGILKKWGHLLVVTHLSDNDGIADRHWLPRKGGIDWSVVQDYFPKKSYTGILTLEVVPKNNEQQSPQSFLNQAFKSALWMESLLSD